ncbi:hypothetical protein M501DRAFT_1022716 [Patellaria atrata CBS 101060]|uniref:ceramidase n=1 Tax=Patellaria atrata CBS 101060 TaxID=1346257 RepID=A0A9P4SEL2_9PEZI|nr:hypothetical protein M501DRAFT_1022716 [Patellaria atrata CBS 101060]
MHKGNNTPPLYRIDLLKPPSERYTEVVKDFEPELLNLVSLFQEVVEALRLPLKPIQLLSKLFLRRLYEQDQLEEIRGIAKQIKIELYLLVALNVLLDTFMGCTSGGVRVRPTKDEAGGSRMMHFRTLDWGMDALRKVVVQFEYVVKGEVVARTISYVGFVGCLTGVRKGLSISLNFRPNHNDTNSLVANTRFYFNHLLVLLGLRPSISSILRSYILPQYKVVQKAVSKEQSMTCSQSLKDILETLPSQHSTAAYLIFCSGENTAVVEKDHITAKVYESSSFIAATNHDAELVTSTDETNPYTPQHDIAGMADLIEDSTQRKACVSEKWQRACQRSGLREGEAAISQKTLVNWVSAYPICNEETHYACIMDPTAGSFVWVRRLLPRRR